MRCAPRFSISQLITFCFASLAAVAQPQEISTYKAQASQLEAALGSRTPTLRDTTLFNRYYKLAVAYAVNDTKPALAYAHKALAFSQKIGYPLGTAKTYNCIGTIFENRMDIPKALFHYKKALGISEKIKDKSQQAASNGNIGNIYGGQGNYQLAFTYMLRALDLAKALKDQFFIAGLYNNIGVLYMQQGNNPEALTNFLNCLKIMQAEGAQGALATICNNIGQIYAMENKPELALDYLNKGLQAAIKAQDIPTMADSYYSLGNLFTESKSYTKALQQYRKTLDLNEKYENPYGTARAYTVIARTLMLMGRNSEALAANKKAYNLLQDEVADLDLYRNYHEIEARLHAEKKDFKLAYQNHVQFKKLTDSLLNRENADSFARLKLQYDVKSAQDSIREQQIKKDIMARAEIKSQQETRNFIYIVLGLVVAFLIILLWQRNKIAIVKRQKALEQQRNRISRDLHDNLGSQLSTVRMFMSSLRNGNKSVGMLETVDNSIGLLDASIDELRGIMNEMQSPLLPEQGYLAATESLINKVNQLHGVQFTLTHHKMEDRMPAAVEEQLFRITQELINNTLKYASAQNVSLDLLKRDGKVVLMYEDDGIGYDLNTVSKGFGLRNMEARVALVQGTVEFDSHLGKGARTNVEIPLHHA